MSKSITLQRSHKVSKQSIAKYPKNSIWVDVWHSGFPSPDGCFNINVKQSEHRFKNYWTSTGVTRIGFTTAYSVPTLLSKLNEILTKLELDISVVEFYGSSLGNGEWLRKQYLDSIKLTEAA